VLRQMSEGHGGSGPMVNVPSVRSDFEITDFPERQRTNRPAWSVGSRLSQLSGLPGTASIQTFRGWIANEESVD